MQASEKAGRCKALAFSLLLKCANKFHFDCNTIADSPIDSPLRSNYDISKRIDQEEAASNLAPHLIPHIRTNGQHQESSTKNSWQAADN